MRKFPPKCCRLSHALAMRAFKNDCIVRRYKAAKNASRRESVCRNTALSNRLCEPR